MSKALELADKLNSLCVAEFAWPHLNDAATELRRLHAANVCTSDLCTQALDDVRRLAAEVEAQSKWINEAIQPLGLYQAYGWSDRMGVIARGRKLLENPHG